MADLSDFLDGSSSIYQVFRDISANYKDSADYAKELVRILPMEIKSAKVKFDKTHKFWRYFYGSAFRDVGSSKTVIGTNQWIEVRRLYEAIRVANKLLECKDLLYYLERLKDPDKHESVLFEMRPVRHFTDNRNIHYEVSGSGNHRIDWQIKYGFFNLLFDVKYRIKSFIDHIKDVIPKIEAGQNNIEPPNTNPEDLFKSTQIKFNSGLGFCKIQGVWLSTMIKENYNALLTYFNNELDDHKIHFVVISEWDCGAFILSRNPFQKYILKKVFKLKDSKQFTL